MPSLFRSTVARSLLLAASLPTVVSGDEAAVAEPPAAAAGEPLALDLDGVQTLF